METLKDKKIALLEELVKDLASLINSEDAIAVGLKNRLSDLAALSEQIADKEWINEYAPGDYVKSEQPDTAPTVTDDEIRQWAKIDPVLISLDHISGAVYGAKAMRDGKITANQPKEWK